jgi:AraC-like DNA-binding protein
MSWTLFIIVAGALQGILLSLVIFKKHHNEKANVWLSAFILTFAFITLSDVFDRTVGIHQNSALLHLFDWSIFLLGPFLLMYLREMTGEKYQKRNGWFLHFLPAAIALLIYVLFYTMSSVEKIKIVLMEQREEAGGNPGFLVLLIAVQMIIYFLYGFSILSRYSRRLKEKYSAIEKRNLDWLRIILGINLLMWIIWIFALYTSSSIARILDDICFPIVVYLFGYIGISQTDMGQVRTAISSIDSGDIESKVQSISTVDKIEEKAVIRYERSGLTSDKAEILKHKLDTLMLNERPYLEDDLSLRELADRLEVFPHHLSQLLNEHYGQNFFDYINSYRAQEVKNMLSDPNQKDESILSIAFTCGFNSKATFNAFFKKQTGQTPRQFRADCESKKV